MKKHLIFAILLLLLSNAAANQIPYITDVKKEINEDELNITFSLHDKESREIKVYLLDKRSGYMITGKHPGVSGDIGDKVKTGPGKKISCNLSKFTAKIIDPIIFASDGEALGTEMIKLFENEEEIVYLSRYEVMNVQFLLFLESDGYSNQEYWKINDTDIVDEYLPWDYCTRYRWIKPRFWDLKKKPYWEKDKYSPLPTTPVVGVSWFEANAFILWSECSLMTKKDWFRIILGNTDEPPAPWAIDMLKGEKTPKYNFANVSLSYKKNNYKGFNDDGYEYCSPSGIYRPFNYNGEEVYDLLGNVYEWTQDFAKPVQYSEHTCVERFIIGGCWMTNIEEMKYPINVLCPIYRKETIGFRYKIVIKK